MVIGLAILSIMKLRRYQFNSLPFVSIVDEAGCPIDPYVSCYLNGALSAKSANTRFRYANELLFMLQYFSEKILTCPRELHRVGLSRIKSTCSFMTDVA